jgi:putative mycofactocin binding protein MftB
VASTEPTARLAGHAAGAFDPDRPARLHDQVALRPEPFGALAYHYGTRRLLFVKSEGLVRVLQGLAEHASARDAAVALAPEGEVDAVVAALGRLHEAGVVDGR